MEAFWVSTGIVALAEMGDKTQLLALLLAARFRRPWPIVAGILVATLANHAAAAWLGSWLGHWLAGDALRWLLGASFLAMALWVLVPDRLEDQAPPAWARGIFLTTLILFFIAEMADKTQIATVVLAAQYSALLPVVAGTTVGMMIANVPVVLLGERITRRLPIGWLHAAAALLFVLLGAATLIGGDSLWPG